MNNRQTARRTFTPLLLTVFLLLLASWGARASDEASREAHRPEDLAALSDTRDVPAVTIMPTRGPAGTVVSVVATGFEPGMPVIVGVGQRGAGFAEVARGVTDPQGAYTLQVTAQGTPGTNLAFAISAERQSGAVAPELFHITEAP